MKKEKLKSLAAIALAAMLFSSPVYAMSIPVYGDKAERTLEHQKQIAQKKAELAEKKLELNQKKEAKRENKGENTGGGEGTTTPPESTTTPPIIPPPTVPNGMVSINFDDGLRHTAEKAVPLLDQNHLSATFFVNSDRLGSDPVMTVSELLNLQNKGYVIENHTRNHLDLTTLNASDLQNQVTGGRQDLVADSFSPLLSFAYPFGSFNQTVIDAVKASGATNARTIGSGLNPKGTNPYAIEGDSLHSDTTFGAVKAKIDQAIATNSWYVIVIHHIDDPTNGGFYNISGTLYQQIIDYLKTKNVRVVNMSQGTDFITH